MTSAKVEKMQTKIDALRREIAAGGAMRPGTLTVQYRDPMAKRHPFNQLSYTHRSQSRSNYIRPEHVNAIRMEVAEYKRFRKMVDILVDLSIQVSKLKMLRSRD